MNNSILLLCAALLLAGCTKHALIVDTPSAPATPAVTQVAEPASLRPAFPLRQTRSAAADAVIRLKNPSFNPDKQGRISDWEVSEHGSGKSYTFVADIENAHTLPSSARIRRHGAEHFGSLQQTIIVHPLWHNKTVRLAGWLRGEGINGAGGALTLRADGGSGQILDWNFMQNARIKGTQDWKRYAIELKIPPSAFSLTVGVMLEDGGTLWADDLSIELID